MKILFVADWFIEDFPFGGAEIANDVIISKFIEAGHEVQQVKSENFSSDLIDDVDLVLVGNFINLSLDSKQALEESEKYSIIEHDFKMLANRCPLKYRGYYPRNEVINLDFFSKARKVICQSSPHEQIVREILKTDNIISLPCNPWKDESLELLESLSDTPKNGYYCILGHRIPQKNTVGAIEFCLSTNIDFCLINPKPYEIYIQEMAKMSGLVFFPQVFETFSRVAFEARALNLEIISNNNVSFLKTDAGKLQGKELIEFARKNNKNLVDFLS